MTPMIYNLYRHEQVILKFYMFKNLQMEREISLRLKMLLNLKSAQSHFLKTQIFKEKLMNTACA